MVVDDFPFFLGQCAGAHREVLDFLVAEESRIAAVDVGPAIAGDLPDSREVLLAHEFTADIGLAQKGAIVLELRHAPSAFLG